MRFQDFGFNAERHERRHPKAVLLARFAICLVFSLGMSRFGFAGLVLSLFLWGYLFAPTLLGLLAWARRSNHARAWRDVEGRYYEFKGTPVGVEEDDRHRRWISLDDFGRALGERPRETALRSIDAEGLQTWRGKPYLLDETALAYLAGRSTERAARLRVWIERTVWHPTRQRRR